MPTKIKIVSRYHPRWDYVVRAAVTFNNQVVNAETQRTDASGVIRNLRTEDLADGAHIMHVIPEHSSAAEVGPDVAENLNTPPQRIFRSLNIDITVREGQIENASVSASQEPNGAVERGNDPRVTIKLQPVFFRAGKYDDTRRGNPPPAVSMILIHQTWTTANIAGTLNTFKEPKVSSHYVVSSGGVGLDAPRELAPRVVKVVQDSRRAWHADDSFWDGTSDINSHSIGIENSHQTGTPWPDAQISALLRLIERLLKAYPAITPRRIVGHSDVKVAGGVLTGRDCPGLDFEWPILERQGFGLVPRGGTVSLDSAYGGFFSLRPVGLLQRNDKDSKRVWGGGKPWQAPSIIADAVVKFALGEPRLLTVSGTPIRELQTDLRAIGYSVRVNGEFDPATQKAVQMFQQHFFAGSRKNLITNAERGKVGRATAEFIKRVRP